MGCNLLCSMSIDSFLRRDVTNSIPLYFAKIQELTRYWKAMVRRFDSSNTPREIRYDEKAKAIEFTKGRENEIELIICCKKGYGEV